MLIITKVLGCCLWCFEICLKYLEKNAYIQIALRGKNFCTSAKAAWTIITHNVIRFGMVGALGFVLHAIGYCIIMISTTFVGYLLLKAMHPNIAFVIPLTIYCILGYIIGKLYLNVYGLAVDTSLQCVIMVEKMGHEGDFIPEPLEAILPAQKESGDWKWGWSCCG